MDVTNTEELCQALNGGSKFTKLDLADAYLQRELNEESKNMVVINMYTQRSSQISIPSCLLD